MPDTLNEWGQRAWRHYGRLLLDVGLLTQGDQIALELLCQVYGRWIEAERAVALTGEILQSDRGNYYQNPYLAVANRSWEQVRKMLAEFGLTPAERTRVAALAGEQSDDLAAILFGGLND